MSGLDIPHVLVLVPNIDRGIVFHLILNFVLEYQNME